MAFTFSHRTLKVEGQFGYALGVNVARVRFANVQNEPRRVVLNGKAVQASKVVFNVDVGVLDVALDMPFTSGFTLAFS